METRRHHESRSSARRIGSLLGLTLAVAAAGLAGSPLRAEENQLGTLMQKPELSALMPKGWVEIPQSVLQEFAKASRKSMGAEGSSNFEYGFQQQSGRWFSLPYVLVRVDRSGRVPDTMMKDMGSMKSEMQSALTERSRNSNQIVQNGLVEGTTYDPDRKIVWTNATMDIKGLGRVNARGAIYLTSYGYVQAIGYTPAPERIQAFQPGVLPGVDEPSPQDLLIKSILNQRIFVAEADRY